MDKKLMKKRFICWLLCLYSVEGNALSAVDPAYSGGRSTRLQAIARIAYAGKTPLGIIFGKNPEAFCGTESDYNFVGMPTYKALQVALEGSGYALIVSGGIYHIAAKDLTNREKEVVAYKFDSFYSRPTSMKDLGLWLTGYVSDVIEGAGSFLINSIGSSDDEIITIERINKATAPEIADAIVAKGSRGLWTMQAIRGDTGPKPGSTVVNIYSYHDAASTLRKLACPGTTVEKQ